MFGAVAVGDHVKARRDLTRGFTDAVYGTPTVRRGQRGIVREVNLGVWRRTCTVEFDSGWSARILQVRSTDLRRTFSHGDAAWEQRRDVSRGMQIGALVMAAPIIAAVTMYLLQGGDPALLALATVGEILNVVFAVAVAHPLLALLAAAGWIAVLRIRRRRAPS